MCGHSATSNTEPARKTCRLVSVWPLGCLTNTPDSRGWLPWRRCVGKQYHRKGRKKVGSLPARLRHARTRTLIPPPYPVALVRFSHSQNLHSTASKAQERSRGSVAAPVASSGASKNQAGHPVQSSFLMLLLSAAVRPSPPVGQKVREREPESRGRRKQLSQSASRK